MEKGRETMRRLLIRAAALGLFAVPLGCHTLHGICDCDNQLGMGTPTAPIAPPPPVAGPGHLVPVAAGIPGPVITSSPAEPIPAPTPGPGK